MKPYPDDDAITTEEMADMMGLNWGDTFLWDGEPFRVVATDDRMSPWDRDSLTVEDPTVSDPQNGRYGNWGVPMAALFGDWLMGDVEPARLEAVES